MCKCGALGGTITENVFKSVTQVQQQANAYAHSVPPADNHALGFHSQLCTIMQNSTHFSIYIMHYTCFNAYMLISSPATFFLLSHFLQNSKGGKS